MSEPLCDLVLLSWNHLEATQPCLETLFRHTDMPCRLIIVDNGSQPEVRRFLRGVRPQGAIQQVELLQHEINEGFPRGMNRGLRASRAPYVCLLNNDVRVTPGWLSRMLEVASAHPDIGLFNPASNTFGNHPPAGHSLEAYAASLELKRGRYVEMGMCIGFCLLIRRALIERIGWLSEEVERFSYEDEDYSMRAQAAGFQCVAVESAYVYHGGEHTIRTIPERQSIYRRNQQWCERRWGRHLRVAAARFAPIAPASGELRDWLAGLVRMARRRGFVYVYAPMRPGFTCDELFRSVGLVPHADVQWRSIPRRGSRLAALGLIMKRRKKRFDLIVAPDPAWANLAGRFRWLHGADIALASEPEQLERLWQRRSRSPS